MCCIIKGLDVPLFIIRIYSGGIKTASFGGEMDEIWIDEKKLDFSAELA